MAFCGSTALAPPGPPCPRATPRWAPSPAASLAGVGRVFGTAFSQPSKPRRMREARSTGICTLLMPRSFALTITPPALAGPALSGGEALGRSRGGFSTKIHLRAEGKGRPIVAVLTGGERHEQIALEDVLDRGAIPRSGRGRPRLRPRRVAGDTQALSLAGRVKDQRQRERGRKVYSLHAPEVECIGKGKAHKPYEFGVKVSVATPLNRCRGGQFVAHVKALPGNPYDGHTLAAIIPAIEACVGAGVDRVVVG